MTEPTRIDYLKSAEEARSSGDLALAALLAEEADHRGSTREENARTARDYPGGIPREES